MRVSKRGTSVTLEVSLWRRPDGHIRIIGKDGRQKVFMSTVTDDADSARRHLHLFKQLNNLLQQMPRQESP